MQFSVLCCTSPTARCNGECRKCWLLHVNYKEIIGKKIIMMHQLFTVDAARDREQENEKSNAKQKWSRGEFVFQSIIFLPSRWDVEQHQLDYDFYNDADCMRLKITLKYLLSSIFQFKLEEKKICAAISSRYFSYFLISPQQPKLDNKVFPHRIFTDGRSSRSNLFSLIHNPSFWLSATEKEKNILFRMKSNRDIIDWWARVKEKEEN